MTASEYQNNSSATIKLSCYRKLDLINYSCPGLEKCRLGQPQTHILDQARVRPEEYGLGQPQTCTLDQARVRSEKVRAWAASNMHFRPSPSLARSEKCGLGQPQTYFRPSLSLARKVWAWAASSMHLIPSPSPALHEKVRACATSNTL